MKLASMTGFPIDISKEMQQVPAIETMTMGNLLTQARVLTKGRAEDMVATMQFPRNESGVLFKAKP